MASVFQRRSLLRSLTNHNQYDVTNKVAQRRARAHSSGKIASLVMTDKVANTRTIMHARLKDNFVNIYIQK